MCSARNPLEEKALQSDTPISSNEGRNTDDTCQPNASATSSCRAETIDYIGDLLFELRKLPTRQANQWSPILSTWPARKPEPFRLATIIPGMVGDGAAPQCDGR